MRSVLAVVLFVAAGCASREAEVATNLTPEAAAEIVDLLRDSDGDCVLDMPARQEEMKKENGGSAGVYRVLVPRRHRVDAQDLLHRNKLPRPPDNEDLVPQREATRVTVNEEGILKLYLAQQKRKEIEQTLLKFPQVASVRVSIAQGHWATPAQRSAKVPDIPPTASVAISTRSRECDVIDEETLIARVAEHVASSVDRLLPSAVTVTLIKQQYLSSPNGRGGIDAGRNDAMRSTGSKWCDVARILGVGAGALLLAAGFLAVAHIKLRRELKRSLARRPLPGLRRDDDNEDR